MFSMDEDQSFQNENFYNLFVIENLSTNYEQFNIFIFFPLLYIIHNYDRLLNLTRCYINRIKKNLSI